MRVWKFLEWTVLTLPKQIHENKPENHRFCFFLFFVSKQLFESEAAKTDFPQKKQTEITRKLQNQAKLMDLIWDNDRDLTPRPHWNSG